MTKVACLSVDGGRFWKSNREVTWISGKRPCLYKTYGSPGVVTSLALACCEVLCGITAFVCNKYPFVFPTSLRSD